MSTPIDAHFVYTPRSGDRCIAVVPTDEVVVVTWPNQSRHAVGRLRQVEVEAANPGQWFRRAAREVAACFVTHIGGIAVDECGMIVMIVPDGWHEIAVELVASAEHETPEQLCRIAVELAREAEEKGLANKHVVSRDAVHHAKYQDLEPLLVEGGVQ